MDEGAIEEGETRLLLLPEPPEDCHFVKWRDADGNQGLLVMEPADGSRTAEVDAALAGVPAIR